MTVYKTEYYTLGRGKEADGEIGNLKQWDGNAYIYCEDTRDVQSLLEAFYKKPHKNGSYYFPVIKKITALKGHCIIDDE